MVDNILFNNIGRLEQYNLITQPSIQTIRETFYPGG